MDSLNPQLNPNYGQRNDYPGGYSPQQEHLLQQGGFPQQGGYPQQVGYPQEGIPMSVPPPPGFPNDPHSPQGAYGVRDYANGQPVKTSLIGDNDDVNCLDFNNQTLRRGFIRKVYGLLTCQLLLTMSVVAFFMYCEPVKDYVSNTPMALWIAMGLYLVLVLVLKCVTEARRRAPLNLILLFMFTYATSYMLGVIGAMVDSAEVMMAVGVTAFICLTLTLFAFQTKYDFTMCSGFMLCSLIALLFIGLFAVIWPSRILIGVYSGLGVVIFSFLLVYHTQLMLGGNHQYSITPEEYVFAALTLYLDVINIFLRVLSMMNR